ncbi:MAG: ribosome maturation factor RimM [Acidobacteriota bacterium]
MSDREQADSSDSEMIAVGRIVRPHGVRGEASVEALTENSARWKKGSRLRLHFRDRPPERTLEVASSRVHRERILVRFAGVEDRDAVEKLRGGWLSVARGEVPPAEAGSFYQFELIGCTCRDTEQGHLGEVVEVVEDGGGFLLIVDDGERRVPIPFARDLLAEVNVAGGEIVVNLPEGLLETCASRS